MQSPNLLIVADDPLARSGLTILLANHPDSNVIGQVSGTDFLQDFQDDNDLTYEMDVIVWDLGWDFDGEPPAWQEVDQPIVALVPDGGETAVFFPTTISSILSRDSSAEQIIAAAQAAMLGLATFDPTITQLGTSTLQNSDIAPIEDLTPRELQVIQLIAEGMTNKAIAQQLYISAHTVKFHVNAIMNKLAVQSRTAAVVQATRLGLISL